MACAGELGGADTWARGCTEEGQSPAKGELGGLGTPMLGEKTNWEECGRDACKCPSWTLDFPLFFCALWWIWDRWYWYASLNLSCWYPGSEMQRMSWIAPLEQGSSAPIHVPVSMGYHNSLLWVAEEYVLSSSGGINRDTSQSLTL